MNIKSLTINHEFRHFTKIIMNFPINSITLWSMLFSKATLFIFFPAATWTRFIAPDFLCYWVQKYKRVLRKWKQRRPFIFLKYVLRCPALQNPLVRVVVEVLYMLQQQLKFFKRTDAKFALYVFYKVSNSCPVTDRAL